jgi:hypothetical protein
MRQRASAASSTVTEAFQREVSVYSLIFAVWFSMLFRKSKLKGWAALSVLWRFDCAFLFTGGLNVMPGGTVEQRLCREENFQDWSDTKKAWSHRQVLGMTCGEEWGRREIDRIDSGE